MRLESHWRILKKDYASRFTRRRLDVLTYIICTGLVRSRMHSHTQVEAGRKKPSAYHDFVHLWRVCASAVDSSVISDRGGVPCGPRQMGVQLSVVHFECTVYMQASRIVLLLLEC
ncbi:hypothetical protein LIPSTDRAFT_224189 [Lipomyces starkeyi NRRL Y-11557]|uniref:Uncharacterized protein n=1 Tax=Lipomyces starkeyi NRRL Y-11557 TaxID=675824 RepID=A0A1E3QED1_LIPST|nr:hypothetical protein LIPSTDRAFT_224189 [Lipomyces starkeyi NRRL Y-11557]